jgi:hypothetical protein
VEVDGGESGGVLAWYFADEAVLGGVKGSWMVRLDGRFGWSRENGRLKKDGRSGCGQNVKDFK